LVILYRYSFIIRTEDGTRGGTVLRGTAVQTRRSRVLFPTGSLRFLIDLILPTAVWLWGQLNSRWGRVVNATLRPFYPRQRDSLPILQQTGWAPRPPEMLRNISHPSGFEPTFTDQHKLSRPGTE